MIPIIHKKEQNTDHVWHTVYELNKNTRRIWIISCYSTNNNQKKKHTFRGFPCHFFVKFNNSNPA